MNITLRSMRYFVATARHGSLSKAAKSVRVSQSAITAAIDAMETELSLRLVDRQRSKGARLTASGRETLMRVQAILDQVDNLGSEIASQKGEIVGELHVACFSPIAPIVLTPILVSFLEKFPRVKVNIVEGNPRQIFDQVHKGEADVGISYDEADLSAGLISSELAVVPPHVIVSDKHAISKRKSISISEISEEPLILFDQPSSREYYASIFETLGKSPNFAYRTSNYEMVRSLVGSGLGVALVQTKPREPMTYSGFMLKHIPITDNVRKSRLLVSISKYSSKRRAVKKFVEHTEQCFQNELAEAITVS